MPPLSVSIDDGSMCPNHLNTITPTSAYKFCDSLTCSKYELPIPWHFDGGAHRGHVEVLDELNPALNVWGIQSGEGEYLQHRLQPKDQ